VTTQQPSVAIVLVNYRGWRDTVECLDSLLGLAYTNRHIFVVDNASPDDSFAQIAGWCDEPQASADWLALPGISRWTSSHSRLKIPYRSVKPSAGVLPPAAPDTPLTLIQSDTNSGFAGGCNTGIRVAGIDQFDFIWLLNTDTVVPADALDALIARGLDCECGMTGSTIRYYNRPSIVQALGGARLDRLRVESRHIGEGTPFDPDLINGASVEQELAYIMGASMLVSRAFLLEVGLMREDYFLYYEEIDWALRGASRFQLGFAPTSYVFHKSGASSSKLMAEFSARHYYRNRVRFASRFFPERMPWVRRSLLIEFLRHSVRGRWLHARIVASVLSQFTVLADEARKTHLSTK
jgi:GT2 family glycosyltransferase